MIGDRGAGEVMGNTEEVLSSSGLDFRLTNGAECWTYE